MTRLRLFLRRVPVAAERKLRDENEDTGTIDHEAVPDVGRPMGEIEVACRTGEVDDANDGGEAQEWHEPREVPGVVRREQDGEGDREQHAAREVGARSLR